MLKSEMLASPQTRGTDEMIYAGFFDLNLCLKNMRCQRPTLPPRDAATGNLQCADIPQ